MLADEDLVEGTRASSSPTCSGRGARRRIEILFDQLFRNDDDHNYKLALQVLDGNHDWLEDGILDPVADEGPQADSPDTESTSPTPAPPQPAAKERPTAEVDFRAPALQFLPRVRNLPAAGNLELVHVSPRNVHREREMAALQIQRSTFKGCHRQYFTSGVSDADLGALPNVAVATGVL